MSTVKFIKASLLKTYIMEKVNWKETQKISSKGLSNLANLLIFYDKWINNSLWRYLLLKTWKVIPRSFVFECFFIWSDY